MSLILGRDWEKDVESFKEDGIEKLAEKTDGIPADYRISAVPKTGFSHIADNAVNPPMTVLHSDFPTISLIKINVADETFNIKTMTYPGIRLAWNGVLIMMLGLGVMSLCWKRER